MDVRYQAWAVPALSKGTRPFQIDKAMYRVVNLVSPKGNKFDASLIELIRDQEDPTKAMDEGMREIGRAVSLLSFVTLVPFSVFAARVLPNGLRPGPKVSETIFPGPPPGLSLFEARLGFKTNTQFDTDLLARRLTPNVEAAITWFLAGFNAPSAAQKVLYYWIGLEAMTPLVSGPWQCGECESDVPECPRCSAPTIGPKTVRSVRSYLRNSLGVDKSEYKKLYGVRCSIAHGEIALNLDSLRAVSDSVIRTEQLLLLAIKKELGWNNTDAPTIDPNGITIVGSLALGFIADQWDGDADYDQPGAWPANM